MVPWQETQINFCQELLSKTEKIVFLIVQNEFLSLSLIKENLMFLYTDGFKLNQDLI